MFLVLPWSYIKWPFSLPMVSFFLWPYELKNLCLRSAFIGSKRGSASARSVCLFEGSDNCESRQVFVVYPRSE